MPILLALGTDALPSADVTVASGAIESLVLLGFGEVLVEVKNSLGEYKIEGKVTNVAPSRQIQGPITYRARREPVLSSMDGLGGTDGSGTSVGLDRVV